MINEKEIASVLAKAEAGDRDAMCTIAQHYFFARDEVNAAKWHKRIAPFCPEAAVIYAHMLLHGQGTPKNMGDSLKYYEMAALKGNGTAMSQLARLLDPSFPKHVKKDINQAIHWYEKAVLLGVADAICDLACIYFNGKIVERDLNRAKSILEAHLETFSKPSHQALHYRFLPLLGLIYYELKEISNYEQAFSWLNKIKRGDTLAVLGRMHLTGVGTTTNLSEAIKYLTGASVNNLQATFLLMMIFFVDGNIEQAFEHGKKLHNNVNITNVLDKKLYIENYLIESINQHVNEESYLALNIEALEIKNKIDIFMKLLELKCKVEDLTYHMSITKITDDITHACHFTDLDALHSMLDLDHSFERQKGYNLLRQYHVSYMNDPDEGMDLVKKGRAIDHPIKDFFLNFDDNSHLHNYGVFTASFTKEKDRLDLWRAYGRDASGLCLAIPSTTFHNSSKSHSLTGYIKHFGDAKTPLAFKQEQATSNQSINNLYLVDYSDEKKHKALDYLENTLSEITSLIEGVDNCDNKEKINSLVRDILSPLLYLFKNKEYETEKELRLISAHDLSDKNLRLDERKIPRIYMPTKPFLFETPGTEIIIGPKANDPIATKLDLEFRLKRHGFDKNVKVKFSEVRYR